MMTFVASHIFILISVLQVQLHRDVQSCACQIAKTFNQTFEHCSTRQASINGS